MLVKWTIKDLEIVFNLNGSWQGRQGLESGIPGESILRRLDV